MQKLHERMVELNASVTSIVHLGLMSSGSEVESSLCNFIESLSGKDIIQIMDLTENEAQWLSECDSTEEIVELLGDLNKKGFVFEICGQIFQKITENTYRGTGSFAVDYAYAETENDIENSIGKTLDRLEPKLKEI